MAKKYTPDMLTAHAALVRHVEGTETSTNTGITWGSVYLDNAKPHDWTPRKWAGVLSALERVGAYIDEDGTFKGDFGRVRMPLEA